MTTSIKFFKTTTLPVVLEGHAVYLVAPVGKPNHAEIYITSSDASIVKRVVNIDDVQSMINTAISNNGAIEIVDNIAARDALVPVNGKFVLVVDATADTTVVAGSATYVWRASATSWIKITEHESQDIVLEWGAIQNKPTSNVSDIDSAVAQRHVHSNFTELGKIGENLEGDLQYAGNYPRARLEVADW